MAMRPPGCWFLNCLICSTAASQSSPVWITRNSGWCSWSLLGCKSSAHDTEAKMRKFAERRILASPSLSKMLFPTSMAAKDCRLLMVTLRAWTRLLTGPDHQAPALWPCDCRRVQDLFLRRKSWYRIFLACSVGGALRFHREKFRG